MMHLSPRKMQQENEKEEEEEKGKKRMENPPIDRKIENRDLPPHITQHQGPLSNPLVEVEVAKIFGEIL